MYFQEDMQIMGMVCECFKTQKHTQIYQNQYLENPIWPALKINDIMI